MGTFGPALSIEHKVRAAIVSPDGFHGGANSKFASSDTSNWDLGVQMQHNTGKHHTSKLMSLRPSFPPHGHHPAS